MLSRENKALEDLQDSATLAKITKDIVLDILKEIRYSDSAIRNLIRLAEDLQTRKVEAQIILPTYEALLGMYNDELGATD